MGTLLCSQTSRGSPSLLREDSASYLNPLSTWPCFLINIFQIAFQTIFQLVSFITLCIYFVPLNNNILRKVLRSPQPTCLLKSPCSRIKSQLFSIRPPVFILLPFPGQPNLTASSSANPTFYPPQGFYYCPVPHLNHPPSLSLPMHWELC